MTPAELNILAKSIANNKFIPMPANDKIFTGGDASNFRQIGAGLLKELVLYAGAQPTSSILEIGSGLGRVSLPLTQYLTTGRYVGTEIVMSAVAWCMENITSVYPNFQFIHHDIYNEFYNPTGQGDVKSVRIPFEEETFDIVFLTSVFTHLNRTDVEALLPFIARYLKPGGRLFGTWFIVDRDVGSKVTDGRSKVPIKVDNGDGVFYSNENQGTLAVGYDEDLLNDLHAKNGFKPTLTMKGQWCSSRQNPTGRFQDLIVAEKASY